MDKNLIAEYLGAKGIEPSSAMHAVYTFDLEVNLNYFRSIKATLASVGRFLHVIFSLPMRIERTQGYHMLSKLTWINFELDKNQNYEYDACTETFRFHTLVDCPASADVLSSVIRKCIDIIAEDSESIMEAYHDTYKEFHVGRNVNSQHDKNENTPDDVPSGLNCAVPLKNTGLKSSWKEVNTEKSLSFSEMQEIILDSHGQAVLIEGPTACGKTLLLRQLQQEMPRRIAIVSCELIVDHFINIIVRKNKDPFEEIAREHDIICIESIDLVRGKNSQTEAAFLIKKLIDMNKAVIINGIKCTERSSHLLEQIKPTLRIFQYVEE